MPKPSAPSGRPTKRRTAKAVAPKRPARRAAALQRKTAAQWITPEQIERLRSRLQSTIDRYERMSRYDAAQTTDENRKHWANADRLGPKQANSPQVRRTLRSRARYERDNAPYCAGMVQTFDEDFIGTGPRLNLLTDNDESNRFFETEFTAWCEAIGLASKLQMLSSGQLVDGEGFALLIDNPALLDTGMGVEVTLDLDVFECDRVTEDVGYFSLDARAKDSVDGIRFDAARNPKEYRILREHPGDGYSFGEGDWTPANRVLHWFRPRRAGQLRGIPEFTPAIDLFAQLRRYRSAVLVNAEIAAELTAFIQTELPLDNSAEPIDAMELLDIVRGQVMTLPAGWKIGQIKPEQPTAAFAEFVDRIIKEIARVLGMPFSLAAGDSSDYSYSGGRLEVQAWQRKLRIWRKDLESRILNRIFLMWMDLAMYIPAYAAYFAGLPPFAQWQWGWSWDGFEHVDPGKEASADEVNLRNNATTLSEIYGRRGKTSWSDALRQRAKEKALQKELGLTDAEAVAPAMQPVDEAA